MSTNWTIQDIERKAAAGKIVSYKVAGRPAENKKIAKLQLAEKHHQSGKSANEQKNCKVAIPKPEPKGVTFIKETLQRAGIEYCTEYRFAKPRMFRFDVAVPALMLAIEYEGLVATGKKGGHQTKKHYTANCTKYNLAASLGWKLYRYTYRNYKDFENDLKQIVCTPKHQ